MGTGSFETLYHELWRTDGTAAGTYMIDNMIESRVGYVSYYNSWVIDGKLVLQGVDGVVFVADSQSRQLAENIESLQDLHANLADEGFDPRSIPLVMQYNKRDLPAGEISEVTELDETLNFRGVPHFSAAAVSGRGVFETLRSISTLVLSRLSAPAAKGS